MAAQQRVVGIRQVAGREDVGRRGAQEFIGHDAVVRPQSGGLAERDLRQCADPDQDQVCLDPGPVWEMHAGESVVLLDGSNHGVDPQVDTACNVERGKELGDLRSQNASQREVEGLQNGHVCPRAACCRSYLQPDPATADNHQPSPEAEQQSDAVRVLDGAQTSDRCPAVVRHL